MTTFESQIASHIASVVVTEFKVTPLIKAHHMDIFIQLYKKKKKGKKKKTTSFSLSAIDQNS